MIEGIKSDLRDVAFGTALLWLGLNAFVLLFGTTIIWLAGDSAYAVQTQWDAVIGATTVSSVFLVGMTVRVIIGEVYSHYTTASAE